MPISLYLCVSLLFLSRQDLKPSNLAVNEDCELKVRNKHCALRVIYVNVTF